jgi:hypothetical protein
MRDLDKLIDEALGEEESELLRRIGGEPNFLERAMGLFGAGIGRLAWLMMVVQTVLGLAGIWAAWMFFQATDPAAQLRWGLPSAVLLLMSLIVKMSVAPAIYHNRVMCELKRIELQMARMRS